MSTTGHKIFISILVAIVLLTLFFISYMGMSYYRIGLEERFYHPANNLLKPSGLFGHGMGIIGSLFMIIGMGSYMARKRYRFLSRLGKLKYWLEFHIFLCTLGPMLVLFHTAFKFGGLVAISFWSMVAVFTSGIIGRFIYIQIPHTIEGRELSLNEVREMKSDVTEIIRNSYKIEEASYSLILDSIKKKAELYHKNPVAGYVRKYIDDNRTVSTVKRVLRENNLPKAEYRQVVELIKNDIALNRRIERLDSMQSLFKYWHVAHLPFALVMLIIMIVHIGVTILFGYRWIF